MLLKHTFSLNKVVYFQLCWVFIPARRLSPVLVCGVLTALASLVIWVLDMGLVIAAHGLVALWHAGSSLTGD